VSLVVVSLLIVVGVIASGLGRISMSYTEITACAALTVITAQTGLYQAMLIVSGSVWTALAPEYILRPTVLLAGSVLLLSWQTPDALDALVVAFVASCSALLTARQLASHQHDLQSIATRSSIGNQSEWASNSRATIRFNGAYQLLAYADIVVAGFLLPTHELGYYAAARALALLGIFALVAMQVPVGPRIATAIKQGDLSEAQRVVAPVTRLSALFAGAVGIALALVGSELLSAFGADFDSAYGALVLLALAQFLNASAGPVGTVVTMCGLQRSAARAYIAASVTLVVLSILLAPTLGAAGIACAVIMATVLWTVVINFRLSREIGMSTWLFARKASASRKGGAR
jgi:O-antigen/teichoic acid export membrane protein